MELHNIVRIDEIEYASCAVPEGEIEDFLDFLCECGAGHWEVATGTMLFLMEEHPLIKELNVDYLESIGISNQLKWEI